LVVVVQIPDAELRLLILFCKHLAAYFSAVAQPPHHLVPFILGISEMARLAQEPWLTISILEMAFIGLA
jgi:hypothetical protein